MIVHIAYAIVDPSLGYFSQLSACAQAQQDLMGTNAPYLIVEKFKEFYLKNTYYLLRVN